ncbi:Sun/nucleolar protein family protein [Giardia muris]|uniref:Sun/nucleolar protein family protein n=1 Tax=Giardia muris TaxID=5742 RepID=A0A4Z1SKS8_GIAMU|nr:Sun/nucleolar protein family protein [Giardia muris]|eukprot:TNJ26264.1 Sun/nucleolar protein family protein [Giardia muris]
MIPSSEPVRKHGEWMNEADPEKSRLLPYYARILDADDLARYMEWFTKPLPATFRVSGSRYPPGFRKAYTERFAQLVAQFSDVAVKPLPWTEGVWELPTDRRALRRTPDYARLHKFIISQHEAGLIVRQEAVSMIPPLFLEVKPGDLVADLCAAPGSKTLQLIEAVGPKGVVLANDADLRRCYVLIHNTIVAATPALAVTNCDASRYPSLPCGILLDRILADVPCSGDGTLRKSPDLWKKWTPHSAVTLHPLQLRILLRGLQLLRPGGRLVYSTCSLNPLEDEAVISSMLQLCRGSVRVVDVSDQYPALRRAPGLKSWPIVDPITQEPIVRPSDSHVSLRGSIMATMFPCMFNIDVAESLTDFRASREREKDCWTGNILSEEISSQLGRTMRFYPWLQDTGGFFVAVLELVRELPKTPLFLDLMKSATSIDTSEGSAVDEKKTRPPRGIPPPMWQEMPLIPLQDPTFLTRIKDYYECDEDFLDGHVLAQRQPTNPARIIMLSSHLARVLIPETGGSPDSLQRTFRLVSAGCGAFEKHTGSERFRMKDGAESWRIPASSEPYFSHHMPKKVLPEMPYSVFLALLSSGLSSTETLEQTVRFDKLAELSSSYREQLRSVTLLGNCFIRVTGESLPPEAEILRGCTFNGWLGSDSLGLHLQRRQRAALYELISGLGTEIGPSRAMKAKARKRARRLAANQEAVASGSEVGE